MLQEAIKNRKYWNWKKEHIDKWEKAYDVLSLKEGNKRIYTKYLEQYITAPGTLLNIICIIYYIQSGKPITATPRQ